MPDVPTLQEQGVAGFEALQWHGFFAPSRTPSHVVERLHTAIVHAVQSAEVKDKAASEGSEILTSSPREFAAFFEREVSKHKEVAKRTGMKQGE
jgi:tripartite-type tricarboxylate transporter receptor subunit TctC